MECTYYSSWIITCGSYLALAYRTRCPCHTVGSSLHLLSCNTSCLSRQWVLSIMSCNRRGNAVGGEVLLDHRGSINENPASIWSQNGFRAYVNIIHLLETEDWRIPAFASIRCNLEYGRHDKSTSPSRSRLWYVYPNLIQYLQLTHIGVVVGIGFFFAFLMMGISWLQNRYTRYSTQSSEEFNTASRSVKPGLIASGIVSAWTWAATLLQSSTVAYQYGVAGPFWYAAGATVQILMFSILACKVKQNAPRCHTYLEIVKARYGTVAHLVFMVFAFVTNILVGSQLLLGGSAVVTSLTGMPVYAAVFLIPVGKYSLRSSCWRGANRDRCLRICYSRWSTSDFYLRLQPYLDPHDHHPLLHVQRVRCQSSDRLTQRNVRVAQESWSPAPDRRKP